MGTVDLTYDVDFADAGSGDTVKDGVLKDQVHSASDEPRLRWQAASGRPFDLHRDGFGAERRVARDDRLGVVALFDPVVVMCGFEFNHGTFLEVVQIHAVFICRGRFAAGFGTWVRTKH
jgi:hypothetical protein